MHPQAEPAQQAAAVTDGGAGPVAERLAAMEESLDASAADEDCNDVYDSDAFSDEDEEDAAERGWGTYAPIAAAIDAGRRVRHLHVRGIFASLVPPGQAPLGLSCGRSAADPASCPCMSIVI